ncbi:META domain-containing protein [Tomitella biformata]|uniref:META domain-containing protein n=1 Tax=Tomitella biformata TaxID=630403 RepID=UPI000467CA67|nr:META domain-containing protein [Tomitella biformata]
MHSHRTFRRPSTLLVTVAALSALALTACSNSERASTETTTAKPTTSTTTTAAGASLGGKTFTATEITGHTLVEGSELTIAFEDETIAVRAGCNSMHGGYTFDEATLAAPMLAGTMMACEPELMDQDQWVGAFLAAAPDAELSGKTLTLTSGETAIVLTQD